MSMHFTLVHVATVVAVLLASPLVGDGQVRPQPPVIRQGGILPTSGVACRHERLYEMSPQVPQIAS